MSAKARIRAFTVVTSIGCRSRLSAKDRAVRRPRTGLRSCKTGSRGLGLARVSDQKMPVLPIPLIIALVLLAFRAPRDDPELM